VDALDLLIAREVPRFAEVVDQLNCCICHG
jgi:hypothetical protein